MEKKMTDTYAALSERVLYEDNHLIIVNKFPSEIVQGDKTGDRPMSELVKAYIRQRYGKPGDVFLGVVHRIDRPVSGAVIFARTSKALTRMNEMMRNHELNKLYWAVVKTLPAAASGSLTHYLKKNEKQNKSYVVKEGTAGAKVAGLDYYLLASGQHYHLLEVKLHTGRHHQIRTQLSAIGSPIRGDLKYGYSRSNGDGSIHLHARMISFVHPISKELVRVEAPAPKNDVLWQCFEEMVDKIKTTESLKV